MTDYYTPTTEEVREYYGMGWFAEDDDLVQGDPIRNFDRWFAAESDRLRAEGAAEALSKVSELAATGDDGEPAEKWGEWLGNYAEHYRQRVAPVPEEERDNDAFPNDCLY